MGEVCMEEEEENQRSIKQSTVHDKAEARGLVRAANRHGDRLRCWDCVMGCVLIGGTRICALFGPQEEHSRRATITRKAAACGSAWYEVHFDTENAQTWL